MLDKKNLLDRVAERFKLDRSMLNLVDETRSNSVYDVLGTWMDSKVIPHETYVSQLSRIILALAHKSNIIFVGRGAGLCCRAKSPGRTAGRLTVGFRVIRLMQVFKLSEAECHKYMHEADSGAANLSQVLPP